MLEGSPPLRLGGADVLKIGKSMVLAAAGVLFSAGTVYVTDLDATSYAWLIPVATVGLNALRKFVTDTFEV